MSDYDSKIIRKQIRVYGSVQGVGFRYRTEHAAESVGVAAHKIADVQLPESVHEVFQKIGRAHV